MKLNRQQLIVIREALRWRTNEIGQQLTEIQTELNGIKKTLDDIDKEIQESNTPPEATEESAGSV